MIISELIKMLEEAKEEYGDLDVWADGDYGQRVIERDEDPLCPCPVREEPTANMPERLVI